MIAMSVKNLSLDEAMGDFLEAKKPEVAHSTWRNYRYPLENFVEFCVERGTNKVGDLTGYDLKKFKTHRQNQGIKQITLKNNLSVVRVFLQWCEEAQLLEPGFHELLTLPRIEDGEMVSDEMLELEEIEDILSYLYKFEYGTRRHATFQLMWHTCIRMGTVIALDLDDYLPETQHLKIRHRPETGTPLKNGSDAERKVNLNEEMCEVLDDYIDVHRNEILDKAGRKPLFTTPTRRLYGTLLRRDMYATTRPCIIGNPCPHDRDPDDCDATYRKQASECPSSVSAHPLRRSAITYHLNQDIPKRHVSGRANVTVDVLETHYDARTEDEKAATRKQMLDRL